MSRLAAQQLVEDLNGLLEKIEGILDKQPFLYNATIHDVFGGLKMAAERLEAELSIGVELRRGNR